MFWKQTSLPATIPLRTWKAGFQKEISKSIHEEAWQKENTVFNLTDQTFSDSKLLNKYLHYVPSTPANAFRTKIEMYNVKFFCFIKLYYNKDNVKVHTPSQEPQLLVKKHFLSSHDQPLHRYIL